MPQITLEYSSNITDVDCKTVFQKVHNILSEIADIEKCKSRAIVVDNFYVGNGDNKNALVYLNIAMLPGRSEEIKQKIGQQFMQILEETFAPIFERLGLKCKPTVQIETLETYFFSRH